MSGHAAASSNFVAPKPTGQIELNCSFQLIQSQMVCATIAATECIVQTENFIWRPQEAQPPGSRIGTADFVLYFGPRRQLENRRVFSGLRAAYPGAILLGCSSGGQIAAGTVESDLISGLALKFSHSQVRLHREPVSPNMCSAEIGRKIGAALLAPDLAGVIILSDGLLVNGSELTAGLASILPPGIPIAGGMAGDDDRFEQTVVGANCSPARGVIGAVGLYGKHLDIHTGFGGGWTVFGPRRRITRAERNVLFELDDLPALGLYEGYLGPDSSALPSSGLRFPLLIRDPANPGVELIRTLLGIDRDTGAMTFAGNLPEGWTAQLMRANFERLADGAARAGQQARSDGASGAALLVSCIGRRLVLGQRIDDEIEAVLGALGSGLPAIGFYSYGEFSPGSPGGPVELHNQTMTVLTITERAA
jgi:hypothetical protein